MTLEQECIVQAWAKRITSKPIQELEKIKKGTITSVRQRLKPVENENIKFICMLRR